jgi:hypothetical protein
VISRLPSQSFPDYDRRETKMEHGLVAWTVCRMNRIDVLTSLQYGIR